MTNICIVQNSKELEFILEKEKNFTVLPLDLSSYIYCSRYDLKFINPSDYLEKNYFKKKIRIIENEVKKIKFKNIQYAALRNFLKKEIRFAINSSIFLNDTLYSVKKKIKIEKIILSGLNFNSYRDGINYNYYNIVDILKHSKFKNLLKIINKKTQTSNNNKFTYSYLAEEKVKSNRSILLFNLGYNFKRIVFWAHRNKFKTLIFNFQDLQINFFYKIIYIFLGVKFINFKKKKIKSFKSKAPKVYSKNEKINKIIKFVVFNNIDYINNFIQKSISISKFFKKNKTNLIVSNHTIGTQALISEIGRKNGISSLNISHGTLSKSFNNNDKIYKRIISDSVVDNQSKYVSVQSKITKSFFNQKKAHTRLILTSNLIFAESKGHKIDKKNILYAVTSKDFNNMQFLGVEMYYEFIANLKYFNTIAKKKNYNFVIKLHPQIYDCYENLRKTFKNISFSKNKINQELKKSFVTISFSSTSIEDSLYCEVPVILFDPWKRYRHCASSKNFKKKNEPIYYVNKKNDLITCLKSIEKSDNFDFQKYTYTGESKQNINKIFSNILKI